jgi:type IV secretory pathway VirB4 component|tara:strand:- start:173 stop:730 length:558 start_codon:yes stop_codon:yes gene_type:complete
MASSIVPGDIDGTFPTAGQDNSSQGFRDNFTSIKNNFTTAKNEITSLQDNTAVTNGATSFNDNVVSRAVLKDTAQTVYPHTTVSGAITINHENGHYQTLTTSGSITLAFTNFPASSTLGRIILDVTYASTSHTLTTPAAVLHADNVSGTSGNVVTAPGTGRFLYEFMTPDGGTTILMHQLGKLYS